MSSKSFGNKIGHNVLAKDILLKTFFQPGCGVCNKANRLFGAILLGDVRFDPWGLATLLELTNDSLWNQSMNKVSIKENSEALKQLVDISEKRAFSNAKGVRHLASLQRLVCAF